MNYVGCHFEVVPLEPWTDLLINELGDLGFESFLQTETGVSAFILEADWTEHLLSQIDLTNNEHVKISHQIEFIKEENWNATWESSFDPICVSNRCTIRAPFHPPSTTEMEIIINPKMSFGTGHHQTTHMMVQMLIDMEIKGTRVLDMGCGTGILAIVACKKGASSITAIDFDEWCFNNSLENIQVNGCPSIKVILGDASVLGHEIYDLIIANINRNVLLNDLSAYVNVLAPGGSMLLSGFYAEDIPMIRDKAESLGLSYVENIERDNWIAIKFLY